MKKKGILVIIGIVIIALLVAIFALTRPTSMDKIIKKSEISSSGDYAVFDIGKTEKTVDDVEFVSIEQKGSDYKAMMKAIKKADLKKAGPQVSIDVKKGTFLINIRESRDSEQGIRFYINSDNEVQFDGRLYKVQNDVDIYNAIEKVFRKTLRDNRSKPKMK